LNHHVDFRGRLVIRPERSVTGPLVVVGLVALIFGLILLQSAVVVGQSLWSEWSVRRWSLGGLIALTLSQGVLLLICGLLGLGLTLGPLHAVFGRSQTVIDRTRGTMTRNRWLLGLPLWRRTIRLQDLGKVEILHRRGKFSSRGRRVYCHDVCLDRGERRSVEITSFGEDEAPEAAALAQAVADCLRLQVAERVEG
jgi:hypothetical protein